MLHVRVYSPNPASYEPNYYRFFDGEAFRKFERVRVELLRPFNMPDFLTSDTCTNLNGYFGCEGEFNNDGKPKIYRMLFPEPCAYLFSSTKNHRYLVSLFG